MNTREIEKLNSIRNEMTHLWGSIFIVGGGAIVFLMSGTHSYDYYMGALGLLVALLFAYAYFVRRNKVVRIIKDMETKE